MQIFEINVHKLNTCTIINSNIGMNVDIIVKALNSKSRRKILEILSKYYGHLSNTLTVKEILLELTQDTMFKNMYRESVYKALEQLVDSGLVEKKYESGRGLCYGVVQIKLEIDLSDGIIKIE